RRAGARRRAAGEDEAAVGAAPEVEDRIAPERDAELEAKEEFILSVAEDGMGKRSSAYDYRTTRRGGKGIDNMDLSRTDTRRPTVVAAFPVEASDQIMLMTDGGQLIRCPVDDIRIAGRKTQGVTLFKVAEDERVVSVTRLEEEAAEDAAGEAEGDGG
ncbi:MAG: DNA gyrase C-terminal beta-propeller domain-containing protein, partial [Kiloniellales bacterium]